MPPQFSPISGLIPTKFNMLALNKLFFIKPQQERDLTLESAIKVGRSVARVKPALNNAIFDCKVLSRNHALFWYKDGKVTQTG